MPKSFSDPWRDRRWVGMGESYLISSWDRTLSALTRPYGIACFGAIPLMGSYAFMRSRVYKTFI